MLNVVKVKCCGGIDMETLVFMITDMSSGSIVLFEGSHTNQGLVNLIIATV